MRVYMKRLFKNIVKKILWSFGLKLIPVASYKELSIRNARYKKYEILEAFKTKYAGELYQDLPLSRSQLCQELFVLNELDFKTKGYFVEFGAANGLIWSNTLLLEKKYDWSGILAEPAKTWHEELQKNRNVNIEKSCVWKESGIDLQFQETELPILSTIENFISKDLYKNQRRSGTNYSVPTISINDLLEKFEAPCVIDYMSLDTEGSEFDILSTLNFEKYKFRVITCEHNFTEDRERIRNLLSENGYVRKYENVSSFDDWYVLDK